MSPPSAPRHAGAGPSPEARRGRPALVAVLVGVAVGVWLIDQVSKWLVVAHLEGHPPIVLIQGWLSLAALRNPGAAFSLGTGTTFVFTAIAIAVVVVIVRTSRRLGSLWWAVALGGLLGGAVGNLTDRVFRSPGFPSGHVVDFVSVEHFAVFNCADMAIVGSAILMVALTVFGVELSGERTRPGSSRRPGPPADPAGPGQPAAPVTPHSADPPEPVDRTA